MVSASGVSVVVLLLLPVLCSACFIRNCPLGGKRAAVAPISPLSARRECLRCGPGGLGQCLGPNICCGASIGCFLNTAESKVCERENDIPTPCKVEGDVCGQGEGHCVAEGVCCSDENCRLDATCAGSKVGTEGLEMPEDQSFDLSPQKDLTPDLLHYIKRLLALKNEFRRK